MSFSYRTIYVYCLATEQMFAGIIILGAGVGFNRLIQNLYFISLGTSDRKLTNVRAVICYHGTEQS